MQDLWGISETRHPAQAGLFGVGSPTSFGKVGGGKCARDSGLARVIFIGTTTSTRTSPSGSGFYWSWASGYINSPTIMITEKAAEIIRHN